MSLFEFQETSLNWTDFEKFTSQKVAFQSTAIVIKYHMNPLNVK